MTNSIEKESDFSKMVNARLSRRGFLIGTVAAGAGAFLAVSPVAKAMSGIMGNSLLNFTAIPTSTSDNIIVPKGYSTSNLMSWGDPIFVNAPSFNANVSKIQKRKQCSLVIIPMA